MMKKPLVFVPTYNERENVQELCAGILALGLELDILFLDDNSPDGTGQVIDELAAKHPNVSTIHRTGKLGIGSAHFEGISWAYERGYTTLITMDCDFTHPPSYIPEILKAAPSAEIVVGSRYLRDRSLQGWNILRKLLTWAGHALTLTLLGMRYDATGAFRLYRLDRIPRQAFSLVASRGYSFFFESLYIFHFNGFRIAEIPIALPPRTAGHSKMDLTEIGRSIKLLFKTYATRVFHEERFRISDRVKPEPGL